jgi:hypothetical protein
MPLRDHFKPPVSQIAPFGGLHGMWPAMIVHHLQEFLPEGYNAIPTVHLGRIEIDIATFETDDRPVVAHSTNGGGVATAVWAPSKPSVAVETTLPDTDEYSVRIYDLEYGRRLVAAIEIVSPANKDRPEHRRLFVGKCADLIRQGVAVSIVDLVSNRSGNLYTELLQWFGQSDNTLGPEPPSIYAASCR